MSLQRQTDLFECHRLSSEISLRTKYLTDDVTRMKVEIERLQADNSRLLTDNINMRTDLTRLLTDYTRLLTENNNMRTDHTRLLVENSCIRDRLAVLEQGQKYRPFWPF